MRVDDAALEVLAEMNRRMVWYGDPDLVHAIADRAVVCVGSHPINLIASIVSTLARSSKFECTGYIEHLGRKHNCYEPVETE